MRHKGKTQHEIMQDKVEEYRQVHGVSSVNLKEVAAWLARNGWQPRPHDAIAIIARELQESLRDQYIEDPQGRRVRQKHPQKIIKEMKDGSHEQFVLWHDIREATRPQMQAAFQQRRFGVALDCRRLKIDVDSFNENYNKSVPIQLVFDFTEDMQEFDQDDPDGPEPDTDD